MQITPGNSHAPSTWPLHMILVRDLTPWPLYVALVQPNLRSWVDWTLFHNFAKSITASERWRSVVLARDVSRDFFRSRWASPFGHLVVLVFLLGWPFYTIFHYLLFFFTTKLSFSLSLPVSSFCYLLISPSLHPQSFQNIPTLLPLRSRPLPPCIRPRLTATLLLY